MVVRNLEDYLPSRGSAARMAGEGAVIVVSILLAFTLDAWWDTRARALESRELMDALALEFDEAHGEFQRVVSRNQAVIVAADSLLSVLSRGSSIIRVDPAALAPLLRTPTTDPGRGTLDALLASGDLALIPGRALQSQLADWPASLADAQEEDLAARTFVLERLIPHLEKVTSLGPVFEQRLLGIASHRGAVDSGVPSSGEEVSIVVSDELTNLILTRRYLSAFILSNHAELRRSFEAIRTELQRPRD